MKKNNLYAVTFLSISIIILLISFFCFRYLYLTSKQDLFKIKLENGKRESREIGKLLELQLKEGISKEIVIQNLQNSIVNTDTQSSFICMYNRKGIELCHPDPTLIGFKIEAKNSVFTFEDKKQADFKNILTTGLANAGLREFPKGSNNSEILAVYPVKGSDWMVASHTNINILEEEISHIYQKFLIVFLFSTITILGISFILIRFLYKKYETQKNEKINILNVKVNNLTALNKQLQTIQKQNELSNSIDFISKTEENAKKRIITHYKDELISLETLDIAYYFLNENFVFVKTFKGDQYPINTSLDESIKLLDPQIFYRANRQFIINIKAIKSILMYV